MKPSPLAFPIQNLKKTLKMTWLHMEFVLIFITGPSRAKLGRTARQQLLTLATCLLSYCIVCACSSVTEKTIIGCKARLQFWRYLQYTYHVLTWLFSLLSCLPLGTAYEKNLRRQKEATNYVVHFLSP